MTKDEKIFGKFKQKHSFIFNDVNFKNLLKTHFDKNGTFVSFIIALIENRLDENKVITHLSINKDEWIELFENLYKNQDVIEVYKKLEINPIIPIEQTVSSFSCFNSFINLLLDFIRQHGMNLNIRETELKEMFRAAFGYLLYNNIDCKLHYEIIDNILDNDYDTKYIFVLNNTKLFASIKNIILNTCGNKVNDLIVLLLGMNKALSEDKAI